MSLRASAGSPLNCSGAIYGSVPTNAPGWDTDTSDWVVASASSSPLTRFASPKSSTLARPSEVITTLALFRVTMHHTAPMRMRDGIGHLEAVAQDLGDREAARGNQPVQRLPSMNSIAM